MTWSGHGIEKLTARVAGAFHHSYGSEPAVDGTPRPGPEQFGLLRQDRGATGPGDRRRLFGIVAGSRCGHRDLADPVLRTVERRPWFVGFRVMEGTFIRWRCCCVVARRPEPGLWQRRSVVLVLRARRIVLRDPRPEKHRRRHRLDVVATMYNGSFTGRGDPRWPSDGSGGTVLGSSPRAARPFEATATCRRFRSCRAADRVNEMVLACGSSAGFRFRGPPPPDGARDDPPAWHPTDVSGLARTPRLRPRGGW